MYCNITILFPHSILLGRCNIVQKMTDLLRWATREKTMMLLRSVLCRKLPLTSLDLLCIKALYQESAIIWASITSTCSYARRKESGATYGKCSWQSYHISGRTWLGLMVESLQHWRAGWAMSSSHRLHYLDLFHQTFPKYPPGSAVTSRSWLHGP